MTGTRNKQIWGVALLLFAGASPVLARETLTYKISYGPFRIGTIILQTSSERRADEVSYTVRAIVRSKPAVFFARFFGVYESECAEDGYPRRCSVTELSHGDTVRSVYSFDYQDSLLIRRLFDAEPSGEARLDTITLLGATYDGLSAIHNIRRGKIQLQQGRFYSFYETTYGPVDLRLLERFDDVRVKALGRDVRARLLEGEILFEGTAGWSGKFKAWLSNDPCPVFVQAKLRVFLGSIKITLESMEQDDSFP